ncbi:MAG: molecular chaperone DnaJ [Alphaproteobacteria bacterium]|nr:molecular chaperone DnaJ [Alphaproteobacteria bacterium]
MNSEMDYYQALEVDRNADGETLKKSYRKLAMKYHPDRNPNDKEAEEKFKYINEAYDVLKDEQKKAAYDRYGHNAYKQSGGMGGGNPFGGGFEFNFGTGGFSDIFSDIFSEFMGGQDRGRSHAHKGDDLHQAVSISLEEAFSGVEKEISLNKTKLCEKCHGHGTKDGKEAPECSFCRGTGKVRVQRGFFIMEDACPHCHGSGKLIKETCDECRGKGFTNVKKTLKVKIPAGIEKDSRIRITGEGNAGSRGGENGDFYVFVDVKKHKLYERDGSNLFMEMPVSMAHSALGTTIDLPGIDGEKVAVTVPSGSQHGAQLRIKGKGMPHLRAQSRGDLYVILKVEVPKKMTARQKELLEEFQSISNENTHPQEKSFLDKVKDIFAKVS